MMHHLDLIVAGAVLGWVAVCVMVWPLLRIASVLEREEERKRKGDGRTLSR